MCAVFGGERIDMNAVIIVIDAIFGALALMLVITVVKPQTKNKLIRDVNFERNDMLKSGETYFLCTADRNSITKQNILILKQGKNVFGRDRFYADFLITDARISKKHFLIDVNGRQLIVLDCNSTNGTYLNEEKLFSTIPRQLKNGDIIRAGDTKFIVKNEFTVC